MAYYCFSSISMYNDYQILLTTPSHSQLHLTACEAAIMEHCDVDAVVLTKESRSPWGDGWPTANSMSTHSEKFLRNSSRQSQKLKPVLKNAVLLQKHPPRVNHSLPSLRSDPMPAWKRALALPRSRWGCYSWVVQGRGLVILFFFWVEEKPVKQKKQIMIIYISIS